MTSPKISVLMPAYNAEKYIAESISSILNQTFQDFELIIIDDCSTDKTGVIIKRYAEEDGRVVVKTNERNLKMSKTLNEGLKISRGKYIVRMDADDWSYRDRLEKQYNFMEKNLEVGICGGSMEICDEEMNVWGVRKYNLLDEGIRKSIFKYSPFCHPAVIIRKEILDKAGGYNYEFNPAEDYDLYFRIGKISKFANLSDILLKYRTVRKSMTTGSMKRMELMTIKVRKKYNKDGYLMTFFDKIYNFFHYISLYIIPSKIKFWIFNSIRNQ